MANNIELAREKGIPTVHLNGTGRNELELQYRNMVCALDEALKAMREATPHGRDYYVQGDKALQYAQEKHEQRYNKIARVLHEIEEDYIAFNDLNPKGGQR